MSKYIDRAGLKVDTVLADFIEKEALQGLNISAESFWRRSSIISLFGITR